MSRTFRSPDWIDALSNNRHVRRRKSPFQPHEIQIEKRILKYGLLVFSDNCKLLRVFLLLQHEVCFPVFVLNIRFYSPLQMLPSSNILRSCALPDPSTSIWWDQRSRDCTAPVIAMSCILQCCTLRDHSWWAAQSLRELWVEFPSILEEGVFLDLFQNEPFHPPSA